MVNVHDCASVKLVWRAVYNQRLTGEGGYRATFHKVSTPALTSLAQ